MKLRERLKVAAMVVFDTPCSTASRILILSSGVGRGRNSGSPFSRRILAMVLSLTLNLRSMSNGRRPSLSALTIAAWFWRRGVCRVSFSF